MCTYLEWSTFAGVGVWGVRVWGVRVWVVRVWGVGVWGIRFLYTPKLKLPFQETRHSESQYMRKYKCKIDYLYNYRHLVYNTGHNALT